jgi:hypothetical protein
MGKAADTVIPTFKPSGRSPGIHPGPRPIEER